MKKSEAMDFCQALCEEAIESLEDDLRHSLYGGTAEEIEEAEDYLKKLQELEQYLRKEVTPNKVPATP